MLRALEPPTLDSNVDNIPKRNSSSIPIVRENPLNNGIESRLSVEETRK